MKGYVPTESEEQITVMEWAEVKGLEVPDLRMLFHVPNGGLRSKATAARMKAEGVKAGVPDLFLPVPSGNYHGLFIEMKKRDHSNGVTADQRDWIGRLREKGYVVGVCYGADEAIETIMCYLGLTE